jgi:hypothetical protein
MRGSVGTAGSIIGGGGFPEGGMRKMLSKALSRSSTKPVEKRQLNQIRLKERLSQQDRQEIRRIYLKGNRR